MALNQVLSVWMEHFPEPVGVLVSTTEGGISFVYHDSYLEAKNFIPLSLSLPKTDEAFEGQKTRAYFDNLLQENNSLDQVMNREGIDRNDTVGLLYHLGSDCPGAISCLPLKQKRIKIPGNLNTDYEAFDYLDFAEIVSRMADRQPLPGGVRDPSPLAGVQSKIALTVLPSGNYAYPKDGLKVPTTHILKVPERRKEIEAHLETAAAKLAKECNLSTIIPEIINIEGTTAILIPRFDRNIDENGLVTRIHQEDFAQALGLSSALKYERHGNNLRVFNSPNILKVLKQTKTPALSIQKFLIATFFNLAIGNTDNHAKNHALLYSDGATPQIAPLYDMLPIRLDINVTHDFSFNIGRATNHETLNKRNYHSFMESFGVSEKASERFFNDEVKSLLSNLEKATSILPFPEFKRFDDLIGQSIDEISSCLNLEIQTKERDAFIATPGGWER